MSQLEPTSNELLPKKEYQGIEQKLSEHSVRLGKSWSSGKFKLGLSEFYVILKRLFTTMEAMTIRKVLLAINMIGRCLNAWINIRVKLLAICDNKCS